jgi:hypothetical protein
MTDGKEVIRTLHAAVVRAAEKEGDPAKVTLKVVEDLGLPEAAIPVLGRTVGGHLRAMKREGEMRKRD